MVKGLYTAYTGMRNEQRRLDVLSNNLANSTTTGYKKEGTTSSAFAERLAIKIKDKSEMVIPRGIGDISLGVKIGQVYTDFSQGSFQVTDRSSDLAIAGNGFFAIEMTNKNGQTTVRYTRDGEFSVDSDGFFRTSNGDYLLNKQAALTGVTGPGSYVQVDPLRDYTVSAEGFVFQDGINLGQIGLIDIDDYAYISKYGENYYDLLPGGNIINTTTQIEQGLLEASNVNIVDEMVSMITIQRAYETNQRMITTIDQTLDWSISQVGRV